MLQDLTIRMNEERATWQDPYSTASYPVAYHPFDPTMYHKMYYFDRPEN